VWVAKMSRAALTRLGRTALTRSGPRLDGGDETSTTTHGIDPPSADVSLDGHFRRDRSGWARTRAASSLFDVAIVVAQAAIFVPLFVVRSLDGDEGVYAYASVQVSRAALPFRDFFYEQMPLLPFVYGGWFRLAGASWRSGRLLSAFLAVAVGGLLYWFIKRRNGRKYALAALVLYVTSGVLLSWFSTIETFALSTLFLCGAFVLVERSRESPGGWASSLGSGILAALAIETRLTFGLAAIVVAAASRSRRVWVLGLTLGLTPSLILFGLAPRHFVFDNVLYHGAKTSGGFFSGLRAKADTLERLISGGDGAQLVLLVLVAVVAVIALRRLGRPTPLALWIALALGVGSLVPNPAFGSYFSVIVPFLVIGVVEFVALLDGEILGPSGGGRTVATTFIGAATVFYLLLAPFSFTQLIRGDSTMNVQEAERVSAVIDAHTRKGELILSSWPGYLFDAHAGAIPRTANPFVPLAAAHLSRAAIRRNGLVTAADIERMIRQHRTHLVVFGIDQRWLFGGRSNVRWAATVEEAGYRLVASLPMARIYESPAGG
jgi:hypothetical protein